LKIITFGETKVNKIKQVAVIGKGGEINEELKKIAEELGEKLVENNYRIICGGKDGIINLIFVQNGCTPILLSGKIYLRGRSKHSLSQRGRLSAPPPRKPENYFSSHVEKDKKKTRN